MLDLSLTFPWTSSWCSSDEQRRGRGEGWKTGSEEKQWKCAGQMSHSLFPNTHVETRGNLSCVVGCVCSIFPQTDRHGCSSVVWWFHIRLTHSVVLKFSCNILGMFWHQKHTRTHTYVLCNVVLLTVKLSHHCLRSKMMFRCCHATRDKPVIGSTAWLSYWDPKL